MSVWNSELRAWEVQKIRGEGETFPLGIKLSIQWSCGDLSREDLIYPFKMCWEYREFDFEIFMRNHPIKQPLDYWLRVIVRAAWQERRPDYRFAVKWAGWIEKFMVLTWGAYLIDEVVDQLDSLGLFDRLNLRIALWQNKMKNTSAILNLSLGN
jgi:hypothetical protein